MLPLFAGDAEVVLQPIFWLLLAVLIVGGLLTAVLFVFWLLAHWYWIERPSDEQQDRSEFWEERLLIEQIPSPPPHKKLAEMKSTTVEENVEPQALRAKTSTKRAA